MAKALGIWMVGWNLGTHSLVNYVMLCNIISDLRSGASDGLFSIVVIIVPILKRFK